VYDNIQSKADAVQFAKQLRDAAEQSEHEFIRFLSWLESHGDIWDSDKYRSFSEFLTFESLCAPSRFNNGQAGASGTRGRGCADHRHDGCGAGHSSARQVARETEGG
jgi:hypothetical protein